MESVPKTVFIGKDRIDSAVASARQLTSAMDNLSIEVNNLSMMYEQSVNIERLQKAAKGAQMENGRRNSALDATLNRLKLLKEEGPPYKSGHLLNT